MGGRTEMQKAVEEPGEFILELDNYYCFYLLCGTVLTVPWIYALLVGWVSSKRLSMFIRLMPSFVAEVMFSCLHVPLCFRYSARQLSVIES